MCRTQSTSRWATRCGGPGPRAATVSPAVLLACPIRNIVPLTIRTAFQEFFPTKATVYQHTFTQPGTYSYFCIVALRYWHDWRGQCFGWLRAVGLVSRSGPAAGGARLAGVYFPANGKFYAMGGRSSDIAGSEFTNPFEYDPATNSWTTKSATYPDTHVNNMACGVLADAGTPYIYCVGGSQVTVVGTFDRVFRYDPVTDVISPVAAPWPGGLGMVLPGGFTVFNNKLYILGGFDTITAEGKGPTRSGSLLLLPPGCRRPLFCLFRSAIYPPRPLAASSTQVGAAISRLALSPIQQTLLFITRWRILSAR